MRASPITNRTIHQSQTIFIEVRGIEEFVKKTGAPKGACFVWCALARLNQSNQCTMPTANISISAPGVPSPVPEMPWP